MCLQESVLQALHRLGKECTQKGQCGPSCVSRLVTVHCLWLNTVEIAGKRDVSCHWVKCWNTQGFLSPGWWGSGPDTQLGSGAPWRGTAVVSTWRPAQRNNKGVLCHTTRRSPAEAGTPSSWWLSWAVPSYPGHAVEGLRLYSAFLPLCLVSLSHWVLVSSPLWRNSG